MEHLNSILTALQPLIDVGIELAVVWLLGYAATKMSPAARLYFDKRHRESLQLALSNGAKQALNGNLTGDEAIEAVIAYTRTSARDAIGYFQPSLEKMREQAAAHIFDQSGLQFDVLEADPVLGARQNH